MKKKKAQPEELEEHDGRRRLLRGLAVEVEDAGEDEAHDAEEEHGRDIRARAVEQCADLVGEDGEVVAHGRRRMKEEGRIKKLIPGMGT